MGVRGPGCRRLLRGIRIPGCVFHYIVPSREAVDEVMATAVAAGGGAVREAAASPYGYFGYFSDPDGHLWKVATGA
jgi:hypothetical protein